MRFPLFDLVAALTHLRFFYFVEMKDSVGTSCGRIVTSVKSRTDIRGILLSSDGKTHTKVKVNSFQHWDSSGAHPACVAARLLAAQPLRQPEAACCSQLQLPAQPVRSKFTSSLFFRLGSNLKDPCSHR